ncbi:MAG TPA: hypothetical protein VFI42_07060 [Thermomicrobiaceae bacterium]|nr:hypothetical protein [Thermomicrobiaceae bacterium]
MPERHERRVHTEPAVLDIGGDIGALIVYTQPDLSGLEIEVSPLGDDLRRTHTEVDERRVNGKTVFAGIFPELTAGEYTLWGHDPRLTRTITIVGGTVSEVDWR